MNDILPEETGKWQFLESLAREHFTRAGIKEIRTPYLEITELFKRGIGEGTDVVGKEMYTFDDRGGRSCTMRPEGTASVVRSVLQHGLLTQGVQKIWYGGPMFRYERPQAGRQRQFHQLGVEFLGLHSTRSDVEIISIAWDFLKALGLKDLVLELNTLGTKKDLQKYRTELVNWLKDRTNQLDLDSQKRLSTNPLRILDSKDPKTQLLLKDAPLLQDSLSIESLDRFKVVQEGLNILDIPYKLNNSLVRGLDYYSHTAFEIVSKDLGAQATVCGGGRYDDLIEQLGGKTAPAIGWAIGIERLLILIDEALTNELPPDVYLVNKGEKSELVSLLLARDLRLEGVTVELDDSSSALSKQFKRAYKKGASWTITIGDDEVANSEVRLKKIFSKTHDHVNSDITKPLSDLKGIVSLLKGPST